MISMKTSGRVSLQGIVALAILLGASSVACSQQKADPKQDATTTAPAAATTPAVPAVPAKVNPAWLEAVDIGEPIPAAVLTALSEQRPEDALTLLAALKPDPKKQPNHVLLLGYLALQTGDYAGCAKALGTIAERPSALSNYANLWAAECAFKAGATGDAALSAARVSPESDQHARALFLLGEALYMGGSSSDTERAVTVLEAFLKEHGRSSDGDVGRMHLAKLKMRQKKMDEASVLLNDVVTYYPLSVNVPEALAIIETIKPKTSKETIKALAATSDEQRIRKLRALFARHRSDEAIEDGARYAKIFAKGSELYCEDVYLVAKSYTKLRKHSDSIAWYQKVVDDCASSPDAIKAYYNMGKGQWNAGNRKAARAAFEKVWTKFPKHSYADDAMLYAARILREAGDEKKMRALLERQVKTYPDGDMAKDAHWLLVRDMLEGKKYKEVIKYTDSLKSFGEDDLYSAGRLDYFTARALQELKKDEDASARYLKVAKENPLSFYALLALNRLAQLKGVEQAPADLCALEKLALCEPFKAPTDPVAAASADPVTLPEGLTSDERFVRGAMLVKLGLQRPAELEFRKLSGQWGKDDESRWAVAMLLDAAGAYPLSHDIPRRQIEGWQSAYPTEVTRKRWAIAYPTPFEDEVTAWASKRGIPPEIVWAIMREESGFNPAIESWANARGLLQLMEGTGRGAAKKDGLEDFTAQVLFDASTNIRLGTAYMKELGDTFQMHPAFIIAGYNGGAGNVNRWIKERGELPLDLWIEDIPYSQTRNYTKRVLGTFWIYHWLHGGERVPGLPLSVPK